MCEKDVINWLDVFQSDRMYLGQAVYWIITKNYNGDVNDWDRAERSLFNALEKKELTAYGSGWTGAYPIPWEVWVGAVSDSKSERPMVSYPDAEMPFQVDHSSGETPSFFSVRERAAATTWSIL